MTVDAYTLHVIAHHRPDFVASLSENARRVLAWSTALRMRPGQAFPDGAWRTCGFTAGRGWGKTRVIVPEIHRRVEAGEETFIALMAPTEKRVHELQISALMNLAPPWFKPELRTIGQNQFLEWPNGVRAGLYTPLVPGQVRGDNVSLAWLSELVEWPAKTRRTAFDNVSSATRAGRRGGQIIWDSTAKGRNDLLSTLYDQAAADPEMHRIIGGTTFDNPLLKPSFLRAEYTRYAGVRRREELFGEHFDEAEGALWQQAWIDRSRVDVAPELVSGMVAVDPAFGDGDAASKGDEWGIVIGGADASGHAYVTADLSGKQAPNDAVDKAIALADPRTRGKLGGRLVLERNQGGEMTISLFRSRAETLGLKVKSIDRDKPWPLQEPGVIHVREHHARQTKDVRASGPAGEHEAGRVHFVGEFPDLEREMTSWVPGGKSPNRLDALAYLVIELRGLALAPRADGAEAIRAAAAAQKALNEALGSGRPTSSVFAGGTPGRGRGRFL